MAKIIITAKQSEEIRQLYSQGFTKRELVEKFNVSETCIYNHIKGTVGISKAKGEKLSKETIKKIRELRKQGKTLDFIADKFNCSSSIVRNKTLDIKVDRAAGTVARKARELLRAGKSVNEVSATLKCTRDYVACINMALQKQKPLPKNEYVRTEEIEKQKQLLKEKQQLREKELEEMRLQEIKDFRWGGTVKI